MRLLLVWNGQDCSFFRKHTHTHTLHNVTQCSSTVTFFSVTFLPRHLSERSVSRCWKCHKTARRFPPKVQDWRFQISKLQFCFHINLPNDLFWLCILKQTEAFKSAGKKIKNRPSLRVEQQDVHGCVERTVRGKPSKVTVYLNSTATSICSVSATQMPDNTAPCTYMLVIENCLDRILNTVTPGCLYVSFSIKLEMFYVNSTALWFISW